MILFTLGMIARIGNMPNGWNGFLAAASFTKPEHNVFGKTVAFMNGMPASAKV